MNLLLHDSIYTREKESLSWLGQRFRVRASRVGCTFKLRVNELRARAITRSLSTRGSTGRRTRRRARRRRRERGLFDDDREYARQQPLERRDDDSRERASERANVAAVCTNGRPANCLRDATDLRLDVLTGATTSRTARDPRERIRADVAITSSTTASTGGRNRAEGSPGPSRISRALFMPVRELIGEAGFGRFARNWLRTRRMCEIL